MTPKQKAPRGTGSTLHVFQGKTSFFFFKQPPLGSCASAEKEEEDPSEGGGRGVTTDQTFKRVPTRHWESIVERMVNHRMPNNI